MKCQLHDYGIVLKYDEQCCMLGEKKICNRDTLYREEEMFR